MAIIISAFALNRICFCILQWMLKAPLVMFKMNLNNNYFNGITIIQISCNIFAKINAYIGSLVGPFNMSQCTVCG